MFNRKAYMERYHKKWYRKNRKKILAQHHEYHKTHREQICARSNRWYCENHERARIRQKEYYENHKEQAKVYGRKAHLKRMYGIRPEDYDTLLKLQKRKCGVCKRYMKKSYIDHDHKTGKVRGLVHRSCNLMLGYAQDNPKILAAGAKYLLTTKN